MPSRLKAIRTAVETHVNTAFSSPTIYNEPTRMKTIPKNEYPVAIIFFREDDPDSQRLLEMARQYYESGRSPWGVEPEKVELDELRLNQLRALGYVIR